MIVVFAMEPARSSVKNAEAKEAGRAGGVAAMGGLAASTNANANIPKSAKELALRKMQRHRKVPVRVRSVTTNHIS